MRRADVLGVEAGEVGVAEVVGVDDDHVRRAAGPCPRDGRARQHRQGQECQDQQAAGHWGAGTCRKGIDGLGAEPVLELAGAFARSQDSIRSQSSFMNVASCTTSQTSSPTICVPSASPSDPISRRPGHAQTLIGGEEIALILAVSSGGSQRENDGGHAPSAARAEVARSVASATFSRTPYGRRGGSPSRLWFARCGPRRPEAVRLDVFCNVRIVNLKRIP